MLFCRLPDWIACGERAIDGLHQELAKEREHVHFAVAKLERMQKREAALLSMIPIKTANRDQLLAEIEEEEGDESRFVVSRSPSPVNRDRASPRNLPKTKTERRVPPEPQSATSLASSQISTSAQYARNPVLDLI